jgi:hypothetical protein
MWGLQNVQHDLKVLPYSSVHILQGGKAGKQRIPPFRQFQVFWKSPVSISPSSPPPPPSPTISHERVRGEGDCRGGGGGGEGACRREMRREEGKTGKTIEE